MKVLFLFGGKSAEHEISLRSAQAVLDNLNTSKFEPIEIGITKSGVWIDGDDLKLLKLGKDVKPNYELVPSKNKTNKKSKLLRIFQGRIIEEIYFDIVFPILHGTNGEDGTLQGLFELYDIPYAGPNLAGALLGIDKVLFKKIMQREKIKTAEFNYYYENNYNFANMIKQTEQLGYPVFVKPSNTGSSVGITKVDKASNLKKALEIAFSFYNKVIVEKAVHKAREIEISVLGNLNPRASVPGEIIPGDEFYSYKDKYINNQAKLEIPALNFDKNMTHIIQELAIRVYKSIDCRGMARVDFLVNGDTNDIFVNEVNTIPGFTSVSMYPKLCEASGLKFTDLITTLINLGLDDYQTKSFRVS